MDTSFFIKAVEATVDSPCRIGIMGGEPCLHPQFGDLMKVYADIVPKEKREFWTAGFKWGARVLDRWV
jgi:hypothetical protein